MAESQIAGLFMTPEMYRQQQMQADRQRAAEYAQMAPEQRAAMGFYSAGQGLGRVAGSLLGAQDPQLQRITEQQRLLQGLDVADPDSLMQAAKRASDMGNVPLAMQLAGRAQEVGANAALIAQRERSNNPLQALITSGKYTPASISAFARSNDPNDLVLSTTPTPRQFNDRDAKSLELYDRTFEQLNQEERKAVQDALAKPAQEPQQPSSVREYQFAVGQGYKGTFEQFMNRQRTGGSGGGAEGSTSSGVSGAGRPPVGYRFTPQGNLEAIPGGPADPERQVVQLDARERAKRESLFPKANSAIQQVEATASSLEKDLTTLANHPGLNGITGLIAGSTPALTKDARAAQALFDKILARGQFNELSAMRAASPTGGALGNVSNVEGERLRQAFGALNQRQNTDSVREELRRIALDTAAFRERARQAFDDTYEYRKQGEGAPRPPAPPAASAPKPATPPPARKDQPLRALPSASEIEAEIRRRGL